MQFDWFNFILGLVAGIGTNLVAWWMLFHGIVPKIKFSQSISKTTVNAENLEKSGYRFRVKLENPGWRPIIDVEITATAVVKDLGPYNKATYQSIYIPLNPDGDLTYKIPRLLSTRQSNMLRPIIRFYLNTGLRLLTPEFFPKGFHRKLKRKTLMLEDIFTLSDDVYIVIEAFGYDEFSGSRKYFRSKHYQEKDIVEGFFDKNGLEIWGG